MLNLRKRIKELQEKTASIEAREACREVLENFVNLTEPQISTSLVERLKTVKDSDKAVKKFIQVAEKLNSVSDLGVASTIAKLKENNIYSYPALRYGIQKIEEGLIRQQLPEYMLVGNLLETMKAFLWESHIEKAYNELKERVSSLEESILVARNIFVLSSTKGSFMYEGLVSKLSDHFENPTDSSRSSVLEDLKKFSFSPEIKALAESLTKVHREKKGGIQVLAENSRSVVSPIYSPVLLENATEYFFARGNFYAKKEGKVSIVNEKQASALPEKFRNLCRIISSPNVFIKEGKVSFYLKRNKVDILENESKVEVLFNGSKVTSSELAKNMVSAGLFRLDESQIAYDVQQVADNFSTIYDLDFAKVIESTVHKGSYVILMKNDDRIYLTKVNESQKTKEFFSDLTATQARNQVLSFIGFDIKESLEEYLEKDEERLRDLKEAQVKVTENIAVVEANLTKVKNSLQDSFLSSSVELNKLKNLLESEMEKLKSQHRELSHSIAAFEQKVLSDAGFEVGEQVKLVESGEMATVTAVDSSRDTISVVTANGETMVVPIGKLASLEEESSAAKAKNEEEPETDEVPSEEEEAEEGAIEDAPEAEAEEEEEDNNESKETTEYVKATIISEQGGEHAGSDVDILAADYAAKGDDELVEVKSGEDIFFVEKRFIKLSEEALEKPAHLKEDEDMDDDDDDDDDDKEEVETETEVETEESPEGETEVETEEETDAPEGDSEEMTISVDDLDEEPTGDEPTGDEPGGELADEPVAAEEPAAEEPAETPAVPAPAVMDTPLPTQSAEAPNQITPTSATTGTSPNADLEILQAKLQKSMEELEAIKAQMGNTFTSTDTINSTITALRGMIDAMKKDHMEIQAKAFGTPVNNEQ